MLETTLSSFAAVPLQHGVITSLLTEYRRPNDKIAEWLAKGVLIPVRRGLYVVGPEWRKGRLELSLVANHLYGPSCVSLDYAMARHGLIPERVFEITSVATRRSRLLETPIGRFSYTKVPTELYAVGMNIEHNTDGVSFLMAGPEKALCDKVLLTRNLSIAGRSSMQAFLFDDLRIDPDALAEFDLSVVEAYAASGHKPRQLNALLRTLESM